MAYDTSNLTTLGQFKTLGEKIVAQGYLTETDAQKLISASGHITKAEAEALIASATTDKGTASFEVVTTLPSASEAKSNVLYLYKNTTTGYYDIYALISGSVVRIDDTTVDLSNYYTKTETDSKISSGTAAAANKLATARKIQTNLASSASASFDGSADVTPGVTGTLPLGNGGTGATTASAARTNLGCGTAAVSNVATDAEVTEMLNEIFS